MPIKFSKYASWKLPLFLATLTNCSAFYLLSHLCLYILALMDGNFGFKGKCYF
jgi:hypothetical protein